jgi:hypothetical protein
MRPVRNVFQKLSRTEQRREGVAAYLCPTPLPAGWCPLPHWFRRGEHNRLRERGWRDPKSDEGTGTDTVVF